MGGGKMFLLTTKSTGTLFSVLIHVYIHILGNGAAATFQAILVILPPDMVPEFITGPLVMFCMLGSTAVSAFVATAQPITQALAVMTSFLSKIDLCTCLPAFFAPVIVVIKASYKALYARLMRILQNRSKKKAVQDLHAEHNKSAKHQDDNDKERSYGSSHTRDCSRCY